MQKRGMTLIEVIVSMALISIIGVAMISVIANISKNFSAHAISIQAINTAKSKLERTTNLTIGEAIDDEFVNNDPSITRDVEKKVTVLGKDVDVTYIEVAIENSTGYGDEGESLFIYDTDRAIPIKPPEPEVGDLYLEASPYWDSNRNGTFEDGIDTVIPELQSNYSSAHVVEYTHTGASGNLVYPKGDVHYEMMGTIDVGATNNIVFQEGANLSIAGMEDILGSPFKCKDFTMTNATLLSTIPRTGAAGTGSDAYKSFPRYDTKIQAIGDILIDGSKVVGYNRIDFGVYTTDSNITTESATFKNGSIIRSVVTDKTAQYENSNGILVHAKNITLLGLPDKPTVFDTNCAVIPGKRPGQINTSSYPTGYNIWFHSLQKIQFGDKTQNATDSYVRFVSLYHTDYPEMNNTASLRMWTSATGYKHAIDSIDTTKSVPIITWGGSSILAIDQAKKPFFRQSASYVYP